MRFTKLIPNIFYADIQVGLQLFVSGLGFNIVHDDLDGKKPFCVAARDDLKVHLVQDAEFAAKDRPEIRLETDDIEAAFAYVADRFPQFLHPNLNVVTLRPWGAKEFAMLDSSGVCVVVMQW